MLFQRSPDEVMFHWYIQDDHTLAIANFVVNGERRKGTGRRIFETWERSIPKEFTRITLRAKNPDAVAFWTKMGFVRDPNLASPEEGEQWMVKYINQ